MLQINKDIFEPVSLLRQVAARCAGWQLIVRVKPLSDTALRA